MLTLNLFGGFQLKINGRPVDALAGDKARALLAYLAMENDRAHSRQAIAALLWPETGDTEARNRLRVTLSRLRSGLDALEDAGGKDLLIIDRDQLQLNPEATLFVDARNFAELVTKSEHHEHRSMAACHECRERLIQAIGLYQGIFLEGFAMSDSIAFDEWMLLQQERFQQGVLRALQSLANYHLRRSEAPQTVLYAQRQLDLEPWRESAHRQLIHAHALAGDRGAALAQYQACKQIMEEEFNASPSPKTTALYERVQRAELGTGSKERNHNLPAPATTLVGRQNELEQLLKWLADPTSRLVTLSGPGGVGKTRLALEAAWEILGSFEHGVWWVSLSGESALQTGEASRTNPLVSALAVTLDADFSTKGELEGQVRRYLRDRDLLLILDNFEHLVETGAFWLDQLLREAPRLVVMVTSRRRLNIRGEWLFSLSGLPALPEGFEWHDGVELPPAVQLFYERAAQAGRRLPEDKTTRNLIVKLCILLQGLPLGVELAAAWTPVLGLADISLAIENDLDFLASKQSGLTVRHRSLRAVFNSSWERLSADQKRALAGMSVFQGQFSRSAAEQIVGIGLEEISALEERSLLQVAQDGRLSLHARLRGFAAEQVASILDLEDLPSWHAKYYMDLLTTSRDALYGRMPRPALEAIRIDWVELRAAWTRTVRTLDLESLALGITPLARFARLSSWTFEVARLYQESAETLEYLGDESDPEVVRIRSELLLAGSEVIRQRGDHPQSLNLCRQARFLAQGIGNLAARRWADCQIVELNIDLGELKLAEQHLLQLSSDPELPGGMIARLRYARGMLAIKRGELDEAEAFLLDSLAFYQGVGDAVMELSTTIWLSRVNYYRGRYVEVLELHQSHLQLARDLGDRFVETAALGKLGMIYLELGDFQRSRPMIEAALALSHEIGDLTEQAENLVLLGRFWQLQGDLGNAHHYLSEAISAFRDIGLRYEQMETTLLLGEVYIQAGYQQAAGEKLRTALDYFSENGGRDHADRARAGLAQLSLAQGVPAEALQLVETLLPELDQGVLPLTVHLACYRVLESLGDRRAAEVLALTQRLLYARAEWINDSDLRRCFLENIPVHQKIIDAAGKRYAD